MKIRTFSTIAVSVLGLALAAPVSAQTAPYVRLAELVIDPLQLDGFKAAIREGIATAVRVEPGVLALYAVAEKDDPTRIRVFEVYTDADAYRRHLETPHFRQFRETTNRMVTSRKLLDGVPVALAAKPQ